MLCNAFAALVGLALAYPPSGEPSRTKPLGSLSVLQWNPHWQCFSEPRYADCSRNVPGLLESRLSSFAVDFANLVELNISWTPPYPWRAISAICSPDSVECYDQISLVYNSEKWFAVAGAGSARGCIQSYPSPNRPYIVQLFQNLQSSARVVVVGAHFSHCASLGSLPSDAIRVMEETGVRRVILIADTNRYAKNVNLQSTRMCESTQLWAPACAQPCTSASICNTSREILEQLVGHRHSRVVRGTQLKPSCCNSWVGFQFPFDRIIANFGSQMTTSMLDDPAPAWMGNEFHKAMLARLAVDWDLELPAIVQSSNHGLYV